MLASLEAITTLRRHELSEGPKVGALERFHHWRQGLLRVHGHLAELPSGTCLLFYPDFPAFHPPGWIKLGGLLATIHLLRSLRRQPGRRIWIDLVDLPRWQAPELGYPLRLPSPVLRWAEGLLLGSAHCLTLPSEGLARRLRDELDLPEARLQILPNGARRSWLEKAARRPLHDSEAPRLFYAGDLARDSGRRIEGWIEEYLRHGSSSSELHLVGPRGEWIDERFSDPRIHRHEGRDDPAWMELGRSCHIGLIPYPESPYFSRCMPSKLAAYAAAGLRILSTRLEETGRWLETWKLGRSLPLARFSEVFADPKSFVQSLDAEGGPLEGFRGALAWEDRLEAFLSRPQERGRSRLGS